MIKFPLHIEKRVTQVGVGDTASEPMLLPYEDENGRVARRIIYTLAPDPVGSGRVEITFDSPDKVKANSADLTWIPWPRGNVSVNTVDDSEVATAARVVAVSGSVKVAIRCV